MSLINCPECGHEVSTTAVACTNCGHPLSPPLAPPIIQRRVVVADVPSDEGFPKWAFIPIGILGIVLLFVMFVIFSRSNDETANSNININLAKQRETAASSRSTEPVRQTSVPPATETQTVTAPPSSTTTITTRPSTVSQTAVPPTTVTEVPSDKGTVKIDAKITAKNGSTQNVRNEKFYLLDKDLESILSDADIEPLEGQSLVNSFGLSVLYPSRYSDFNREALSAIKSHIKYSTITDGGGVAQMKSIDPNSYYLFGVTKSGDGFAVWNSPVTVANGQNVLNLSPQALTEVN